MAKTTNAYRVHLRNKISAISDMEILFSTGLTKQDFINYVNDASRKQLIGIVMTDHVFFNNIIKTMVPIVQELKARKKQVEELLHNIKIRENVEEKRHRSRMRDMADSLSYQMFIKGMQDEKPIIKVNC